jgi:mandelate racemase
MAATQSTPVHITELRARAVLVPMNRPLQTAGGTFTQAPLVLIDLATSAGVTGHSYLFSPTPLALKSLVALLTDFNSLVAKLPLVPHDIELLLNRRMTLLGAAQGLVGLVISGIDMAIWDAQAKIAGLPLARLLGGAPRPIPAYNSCGLSLLGPENVAREAVELLDKGRFHALKLRLGYATLDEDVAAVHAVKESVPAGTPVMTDYNQSLTPAEAIRRGHVLDELDLFWIEEPVRAEDHAGNAAVAAALKTPVQIGENFLGSRDMARALAAKACDYAMPDAERIGGVSGWMRAAALADAVAMPMSTHLFPEISSHLMCVTPTAHWLEYVDWASPILAQPLEIKAGHAVVRDEPGTGIEWNESAVQKVPGLGASRFGSGEGPGR